MTVAIDELRELTDNKYRWKLEQNGVFSVVAFSPESTAYECLRIFTADDLSVIMQVLPFALSALIKWQTAHGNPLVYGHLVESLIRQSLGDVVHCRHLRGKAHVLQHVYEYTLDLAHPDRVTLDGMVQNLRTSSVDGQEVTFVTSVDPITVKVQKADLDSRYPGWQERWALADVLGLRRDELRRFIFPVQQVPTRAVAFNDIHFE